MPNTPKRIQLSAEDIISLIKERVIHKEGTCICSKVSFLVILSLLEEEITQSMSYARSSAS